jgi:membrane-associated phospholipid phosphatase
VKDYGIHAAVATDSSALDTVFAQYGTYLLPMAFPEGSPLHPAYGAGHATVAGACVTVLKAWFDVSQKITDLVDPRTRKRLAPVVPSSDGTSLVPYQGPDKDDLTVGGELNKLAMNVGIGRNIAGVHWRSDHAASIKLGEQVAIGVIRDYIGTFNEPFDQLFLQKFDGSFIKITKDGEQPQP